ncbi:hypothetical protein ACLOJK_009370 [Asimina triloba]
MPGGGGIGGESMEEKVSMELTEEVLRSMEVESLRLLSLHDNKYLRYFKGHHDSNLSLVHGNNLLSACLPFGRVVSLSLCPRKECFISGSLDRTVLLWDQRAEKCQGLFRVQGRPAVAYDDQGMVFTIAFGGYIRMFDARKYEKGPFEIYTASGDFSDANVVKFSNDGRLILLTTMGGNIHILDSFRGTTVLAMVVLVAIYTLQVTSWLSTEAEPPVIKWAPGSLMFVTGSSELSFWIPDLSKLGSYVGAK